MNFAIYLQQKFCPNFLFWKKYGGRIPYRPADFACRGPCVIGIESNRFLVKKIDHMKKQRGDLVPPYPKFFAQAIIRCFCDQFAILFFD